VTDVAGEKKFTKLTTFNGEDRNPVWGEGDAFYYLSEQDGTYNIFRSSISEPSKQKQITITREYAQSKFERMPVEALRNVG
jgi:Tol biopolymer transport system component